jgi:hypothetical protein
MANMFNRKKAGFDAELPVMAANLALFPYINKI